MLFLIYRDSRRFSRENIKALVVADTPADACDRLAQHMRDCGKKDEDFFDMSEPEQIDLRDGLVQLV